MEHDLAAITDEQWQELQVRGGEADAEEVFPRGPRDLLTPLGHTLVDGWTLPASISTVRKFRSPSG